MEEGTADSDNKGLVTTGNKIMTALSDVPSEIVAGAGLEPAYRGLLHREAGGASAPDAPSRVGTSTAGADALYVTFNPSFVEGSSPVTGYTVRVHDTTGRQVGEQSVTAADFRRTALVRIGGLPSSGGPFTVTVTAANAHGTSAPSLASLPLTPTAATAPPAAPTGPKLRTQSTAATLAWTPPTATGDAKVIGYRVTVSDGRDPIEVTGRDVLVTQPSAKGMFR
ncbi:fibronectin type III domain-containing protein, partial [Streptomyces sp. NPDC001215]